jgi:hypothetical protein
MKVPHSSPLFLPARFLVLIRDGAMRVRFYGSLSRLLACVPRAVSIRVGTDAQARGQDVNLVGAQMFRQTSVPTGGCQLSANQFLQPSHSDWR